MATPINIHSLLQAKQSLSDLAYQAYLQHFQIDIRNGEIEDIWALAKAMAAVGRSAADFGNFFVGYKIPQIGKEFDLLRFGSNFILNIELKSNSTKAKIEKQLSRNKYYLSFLGMTVHAFTFVSDTNELFYSNDKCQLEESNFTCLSELLAEQQHRQIERLDDMFNPSDYLVSPFNSTGRFLKGEYFLTHQQEDARTQIIASAAPPKAPMFISIIGAAGTGKTLLAYDVAKSFVDRGGRPLIIHCGQLNDGHHELISSGWAISPIKYFKTRDFSKYDLVIVDEAQRLHPEQFDDIVERVNVAKCCCIFSHDRLQTLATWEEARNVSAKISSIKPLVEYRLSEKIRTNSEIANFIKLLFNKKSQASIPSKENIELNYFNTDQDARDYLDSLDEGRWKVLRFTPSQYENEHHEKYSGRVYRTSHQVIGQEFDGVAVPIDKYFSYAEGGDLIYTAKTYYDPTSMLFQNITRTRKRLNVVIIDNEELLRRCFAILR